MNIKLNRVFIVDDDPFWTMKLSKLLQEIGFENIIPYPNGKDCLENIHLNPRLVFLDYQMEGADGITVLQQIKEYYPGILVIFCTAHEDLSVAMDAIGNGSCDYLLKENASLKELSAIIKNIETDQAIFETTFSTSKF